MGELGACVIDVVIGFLVTPLIEKVDMFNAFLLKAIDIGKDTEERIMGRQDYRVFGLTYLFEHANRKAGRGGDEMFLKIMRFMRVLLFITALFYLARFSFHFHAGDCKH